MTRTLARTVSMALALYAVYLGVVFVLQRDMLFPGASFAPVAWAPQDGVERWERTFDGAPAEALFVPHPDATAQTPRPLLVLFHGNGDFAEGMLPGALIYRKLGFHVLIPEYRGYSRVGGDPSEAVIVADVLQLLDEATHRPDVDPQRVAYHGISLGGGVAGAVARLRPPRAMILQSTFTSVRDMAGSFLAPGFLVRDPYDTRQALEELDVPVFIAHGRGDEIVPFAMGEELAATARSATFEVFEGGHGIPAPPDQVRFWQSVAAFMRANALLPAR